MNNFCGIRLVGPDDGEHGQDELGTYGVEYRHGILAFLHLPFIVLGEVVGLAAT